MQILLGFFQVFKYPIYFLFGLILVWFVSFAYFFIKEYAQGRRLKRGLHKPVPQSNLFVKIFYEAPRMYVADIYDRDPDYFKYQGLVIYTGRQGQGKTVAMVRDIMMMQKEYPRAKCITNLSYEYEDGALTNWRQLIDYKNGIYGVIVGLDEIQNWFSSKQSKDFPPEMFEVVTQNRKNRRIIMATTQNFYQPAKDIRAQCTEVRKCMTLLGVFTIVHAVRPILDSNGEVQQWKHIRFYCFVHDKEIRDSYDTYKVIESLMKSGFYNRNEKDGDTNIYVIPDKKKRRKW